MDNKDNKNTSKLNSILLLLTIISVTFSIIQNFDSVKRALGVKSTPNWEGIWDMEIGTNIIGKTQTALRVENGKLIGAYVIYGGNNSVLVTQMTGVIKDNVYKGDWFQSSDSIYQTHGKFNLILNSDNTFQGTFNKYKKDGTTIDLLNWKGKKVEKF